MEGQSPFHKELKKQGYVYRNGFYYKDKEAKGEREARIAKGVKQGCTPAQDMEDFERLQAELLEAQLERAKARDPPANFEAPRKTKKIK